MNKISLLILAGGLGSRYNGQKQVDKITEAETLMEFALYDALQLGIKKFIFIINNQFPTDYKLHLNEILTKKQAEVYFLIQEKSIYVPEAFHIKIKNRIKPLGTAHAVLCAKDSIHEPFITINADDFYGRNSFRLGIEFAKKMEGDEFGIIGFELGKTLSENGKVSRGICEIENGNLVSVKEHLNIQKKEEIIQANDESGKGVTLNESDIVSMNLWVLSPKFFEFALNEFVEFLENIQNPESEEFYLPTVIDRAIHQQKIRVKVLKSDEKWMGLTYSEDKNWVKKEIQELKVKGIYPYKLWN
jgi:UTP-glucose-1-phosphate uridylyltransferase